MTLRAEPGLELTLRRAEGLLRAASAFAFALDDLPGITLPPSAGADIDQAQLRAIATLYLAAELDGAGVLPAADALTRLARSGALPLDFGDAAPLLEQFWEGRNQRTSSDERNAFFAGLFGVGSGPVSGTHPRNDGFEDRFIDLCEALYRLDDAGSVTSSGSVGSQARVRATAQAVLDNLSRAAGSMTVFIAQDVLAATKSALALLGHAAVRTALGAHTLWDVVETIGNKIRTPFLDHDLHVRRGQAGMTILAWLADNAPSLGDAGAAAITPDNPVVAAASDWLEASLSIGESAGDAGAAPAPPGTRASSPGASPWAGLAG